MSEFPVGPYAKAFRHGPRFVKYANTATQGVKCGHLALQEGLIPTLPSPTSTRERGFNSYGDAITTAPRHAVQIVSPCFAACLVPTPPAATLVVPFRGAPMQWPDANAPGQYWLDSHID